MERLAREKPSSLFRLLISEEDKRVSLKLFSLQLIISTNKLERFSMVSHLTHVQYHAPRGPLVDPNIKVPLNTWLKIKSFLSHRGT